MTRPRGKKRPPKLPKLPPERSLGNNKGAPGQLRSRVEREVVLEHLREGWTVAQICRLLFGHHNGKVLLRQWASDPEFHHECIEAMKGHFGPTLDHAVELSLEADVAGENEGAHKAMALVLNYYARTLERKAKSVQIEQTAAVAAKEPAAVAGPTLVLGPEGVKELLSHLPAQQEDPEKPIDVPAELVERTDT